LSEKLMVDLKALKMGKKMVAHWDFSKEEQKEYW
jgi:hypothetical protein